MPVPVPPVTVPVVIAPIPAPVGAPVNPALPQFPTSLVLPMVLQPASELLVVTPATFTPMLLVVAQPEPLTAPAVTPAPAARAPVPAPAAAVPTPVLPYVTPYRAPKPYRN